MCSQMLLRRISTFVRCRHFSSSPAVAPTQLDQVTLDPSTYRVSESNPLNHNVHMIGKIYTIPNDEWTQYFAPDVPKKVKKAIKGMGEAAILIREPAIEAIHYLKNVKPQSISPKIVLYGRDGSGKLFTTTHVCHYAFKNGWFVLDLNFPVDFLRRAANEVLASDNREGLYDLPYVGSKILAKAQRQNGELLAKLKTKSEHNWSKREGVAVGTPLIEIVEHGIARSKHSNDVLIALIQELKAAANEGEIKLLVSSVGANGMFQKTTCYRIPHPQLKLFRKAKDLTLVGAHIEALKGDWRGGAVLATLQRSAILPVNRVDPIITSPRTIFGEEGFELFDPYLAIEVGKYSPLEFRSIFDYYVERRWLDSPESRSTWGRAEIEFLSGRWPLELYERCRGL